MSDSILYEKAKELLDELGRDMYEVAYHLQRAGITGIRYELCGCPIAVYLSKETGAFWSAARMVVSSGDVFVPVPISVGEFMRNFDSGLFPELEIDTDA